MPRCQILSSMRRLLILRHRDSQQRFAPFARWDPPASASKITLKCTGPGWYPLTLRVHSSLTEHAFYRLLARQ